MSFHKQKVSIDMMRTHTIVMTENEFEDLENSLSIIFFKIFSVSSFWCAEPKYET